MIQYKVESLTEVLEEIKGLVYEHAKETDLYQDKFSLDPNYEQYLVMDKQGLIFLVTAREEGEMIGYTMFFIMNHPHYKEVKYANNDMLYVAPKWRRIGVFPEMMEFAEEVLKEMGVEVICFNMKAHLSFENIAKGLGYDRAEIIYSKYIQE